MPVFPSDVVVTASESSWYGQCKKATQNLIAEYRRRTWDFEKRTDPGIEKYESGEWAFVWEEAGKSHWLYEQANWQYLLDDLKHYESIEVYNLYVGFNCWRTFIGVQDGSEGATWMNDNAYYVQNRDPYLDEDRYAQLEYQEELECIQDHYYEHRVSMPFPDGWEERIHAALWDLFSDDDIFLEEEPGRIWIDSKKLDAAAIHLGLTAAKRCPHCGQEWREWPPDECWKPFPENKRVKNLTDYWSIEAKYDEDDFIAFMYDVSDYQLRVQSQALTPRFPGFPAPQPLTKPDIHVDGEDARLMDDDFELCPECLMDSLVYYYPAKEEDAERITHTHSQ